MKYACFRYLTLCQYIVSILTYSFTQHTHGGVYNPMSPPQVLLIKALKTLLLSHNFQVICRVLQFLYVSSRVVCVCVV